MKYFSLFTGIGGFELGIQKAHESKFQATHSQDRPQDCSHHSSEPSQCDRHPLCVGYSEIDKYAIGIYESHFPTHRNFGNIRNIVAEELPDFGLLCGGFPCQSFSIAGKRGGFEDTRGTLFFDIARLAKIKRPRLLFLENVKGLLSHDGGRTFNTIIGTLDELGYDLQWQVLNSKNFGVPQNRERVFIVGHLRGTSRPKVFPFREDGEELGREGHAVRRKVRADGEDNGESIADAHGTILQAGENRSVYQGAIMSEKNKKWLEDGKTLSRNFPQGQRVYSADGIATTLASQAGGLGAKTGLYAIPVLTPDRSTKRQNGRRFKEDGEESFTLTAQDKHGVFDGMKIRRLTPIECERLQGFPDNWTVGVSDTQRYKTLGNAVTVNVIKAIAEKLLA